jgi:hypothetical protein
VRPDLHEFGPVHQVGDVGRMCLLTVGCRFIRKDTSDRRSCRMRSPDLRCRAIDGSCEPVRPVADALSRLPWIRGRACDGMLGRINCVRCSIGASDSIATRHTISTRHTTLPRTAFGVVPAMLGAHLTSWTIRLALVCYALYVASMLTTAGRKQPHVARAIWTAGCGLFLVHVACAFHFYHHWSHAAAWQKTADETEQLLGVAFGEGIYFSYMFLVLWLLDVVWLWAGDSPQSRSAGSATCVPACQAAAVPTPSWRLAVHAFLLFIAINGAIIFESGVIRWAGIPVTLALSGLAVRWAYNARQRAKKLPGREIVHEARGNAECGARTRE